MRHRISLALLLALLLVGYAAWAYPPHRGGMGYGSASAPPTGALTGILLGNNTFIAPAADGTNVGAITVQGTNVAAATLSIIGTDAAKFRLSNTTVPSNLLVSGTQNAGTYSISIVATLPGATGSPFTQPETVIGTALTITSVSISCGGSCVFTPGQAGNIGTASATVSSGPLTGTWSLKTSGTDHAGATCGPATNLSITSAGVLSNNSSAIAGTYPVCPQYTQANAGSYAQVVTVTGTSLPPGFFVATNGTNNGTCSISVPCTFWAARTAMENSSTKLTYVRVGNYNSPLDSTVCGGFGGQNQMVCLGSSDSRQTWQNYPPDGVCSAILDGGATGPGTGITNGFVISGATNVVINGLQIQNVKGSHVLTFNNNTTLENNCIYTQYDNISGPVVVWGGSISGFKMYHNVIRQLVGGPYGSALNMQTVSIGADIRYNFIEGTCGGDGDCGGIYGIDSTAATSNNTIEYNYIRNISVPNNGVGGRCIYLDEAMSYNTVVGNICTGIFGETVFNHSGKQNKMNFNISDLWSAGDQQILSSQYSSPPNTDMTGNTVQHNISIRNAGGPGNGFTNFGVPNPNPTTVNSNLYWNYGSGGVRTTGDSDVVNGTGSDPNPTISNPLFLTCPGGGVDSWSFKLDPTSPALAAPVSFTQPNNDLGIAWGMPGFWGPPGFTIPHTGSAPSYGPTC